MFTFIEIAFLKDDVVLSTDGIEYDVLPNASPTSLVINQLLNQLKLSTIQYGFTIYQNNCLFLRENRPDLELVDDSIRFEFTPKSLLNFKDIYLLNKFLNKARLSNSLTVSYLKWGKKSILYIDITENEWHPFNYEIWLQKKYMDIKESDVLDQRFSILLNEPFLNKLKSYMLFWKSKYQIKYELPDWYQFLYQSTK